MPELTLIATTIAAPGHIDEVRAAMAKLVEPSRREPGCLEYVMHRDQSNPDAVVFYERWQSPDHLESHTRTTHFRECMKAIEGKTADSTLVKLTQEKQ